jgi:putative ABC transport system permease protein
MLRHYILIALRNLGKNKTSTFIHLTGLSLSVGFCLLLFGYIRHEQSYDQFHVKKDRLFRLEQSEMSGPAGGDKAVAKDEDKHVLVFPLVVGGDLQRSVPDVAGVTRIQDHPDVLVKAGGQVFRERDCLYTDSNFFQNFSFRLIEGDPATALRSPHSVVLSATVAKKYFGNREAVGQTVSLVEDSTQLYTVSGVAEDAPANSSIRYDWVLPVVSKPGYASDMEEGFNHWNCVTLVLLKPGIDATHFQTKMNRWVKSYFVEPYVREEEKYHQDFDFSSYRWYLRPLADCHYNAAAPWGHYTSARNIYLLSCLALVILLIAALNYVLLSVANVAARAQETGVRKVMGAGKGSILLQLGMETQLLVLAAVLIGLALAWILLPVFNSLLDTAVSFRLLPLTDLLPAVIGLSLVLGLLAGYYPAMLVARMKAVSVLKGTGTFRINPRLSRVLVVMQYTSCIILMMAAFVINRQMHYISHKDLGFDKEQVLLVKHRDFDPGFAKLLRTRLYAVAQTEPEISDWSAMQGQLNGSFDNNGFMLNGKQEWRYQIKVDPSYFGLMGLHLVRGRFLSNEYPGDSARANRACVVNETLWNLLGREARLGVYDSVLHDRIVGVVKDYHVESLVKKIEPVEHVLPRNGYVSTFMFRVRPGGAPRAIAAMEREWKSITRDYPFEYSFLDQDLAVMYQTEVRWENIIRDSCLFALFIACLGLFGLSAINAANRTREIGIRKVLGATVTNIVSSLSSQFVVLVILSLFIAIPVSWWLMNRWLEDFAYHIEIQWWMFALIGVAAMLTALITVSFRSIRAATANPVDSLRNE